MNQISLAIAHCSNQKYGNRLPYLEHNVNVIKDDPRISEVVLVDDCSDSQIIEELKKAEQLIPKLKLVLNDKNIGANKNKRKAISLCENDWVILLDSDNLINSSYIDTVFTTNFDVNTVYCPEKASGFIFSEFIGKNISSGNIKHIVNDTFYALMNTGNYLLPKNTFLEATKAAETFFNEENYMDTFTQNLHWLKNGNKLEVVKGLIYSHTRHNGSLWLNHKDKAIEQASFLTTKLLEIV